MLVLPAREEGRSVDARAAAEEGDERDARRGGGRDRHALVDEVALEPTRQVRERGPRGGQRVVCAAERTLRRLLAPTKMNLASLGNVVPHVHWHVIPRFEDDPHFPQPIWGPRQRENRRVALPATFVDDVRVTLAKELDR